jgi:UDP-N-acetylglucosamine 1-carboxyvinyltransferase
MDCIKITGGNSLKGRVTISGSKNAALPALCACLLAEGESALRNVPQLRDIDTLTELLKTLGAEPRRGDDGLFMVDASGVDSCQAPYELVKTMRASILVLGPLLARMGRARVSIPGGCAIGARPINLHLQGLKMLGADIKLEHGYIEASADRLKGAVFEFDLPSVTGTENLMMAACLAQGTTVLHNAACEPEVDFLARMLNSMGAKIEGAGTRTLIIEGVEELSPADCAVIPDRIEAGTFMVAAAITGGQVELVNCNPAHMQSVISKLREASITVQEGEDSLIVFGDGKIKPIDIITNPYPGFPTDMQAQVMTLICLADGASAITETIFENRFMHVAELRRMGAEVTLKGNHALVKGVDSLEGARVMATDLRASASLIIAGLAAQGQTVVSRIYHIDRGYERIETKLSALGATISRMPEEETIESL